MTTATDNALLMRGQYTLPHMAQQVRRDLHGETIVRNLGERAHGYRLTTEQLEERRTTGRGGMPYEYLLYTPESYGTSWTAFYTRLELDEFLDAYALQLDHEPEPGEPFWVQLPKDTSLWLPLNDPDISDPVPPPPPAEAQPAELDERDAAILAERVGSLAEITTPKVGDWVRFADGKLRRISHVWDWDDGNPLAQTSDSGSYHLGDGYISMSGGLYPPVPTSTLTATDERRMGYVWFFHHNRSQAHNGVTTAISFPVWSCDRDAPR